ncbi:hypothetical protein Vadar_029629 [Vaccinium darrowii]|uniref:Uncharacterized protein n=1 Tax=Vaccinium darrowii TaxID=229202 RepID=A0ACB7Y3E1_9ERIC|nr:hypothetical protein Vadar_029629 [Vaccinium darrowii]
MANANNEEDALTALRHSLSDPDGFLGSWDPSLDDPCTWDLNSKNLAGHLIPELGNLQHLQYLELNNNNIQGIIPDELGNLKSLVDLELQNNTLTGTIPPSLGNLKSLLFLRLNNNRGLGGNVPPGVLSLPNLKVLDVSNTNVVGGQLTPGAPKTTTSKNMAIPLNHFNLYFLFPIVVAILV